VPATFEQRLQSCSISSRARPAPTTLNLMAVTQRVGTRQKLKAAFHTWNLSANSVWRVKKFGLSFEPSEGG
jgi:hypothetical protein